MVGGAGPVAQALAAVIKEFLQAMDVGQQNEELGGVDYLLLVTGEVGQFLAQLWVADPQDGVELGAGVGRGLAGGIEDGLEVGGGNRLVFELANAAATRQSFEQVHNHSLIVKVLVFVEIEVVRLAIRYGYTKLC